MHGKTIETQLIDDQF